MKMVFLFLVIIPEYLKDMGTSSRLNLVKRDLKNEKVKKTPIDKNKSFILRS